MQLNAPAFALIVFLSTAPTTHDLPWGESGSSWRSDRAWYDGRAEKAVYAATRTIYGLSREYHATAYTNKQHMDARAGVKATDGDGVEVFKHHWSERVPTENYDYDFSTAAFLRTDDLATFKLTAATQDDCGSSFKQVWRDARGKLAFLESVYFPGAGLRQGTLRAGGVLEDALPLLLRDFPFDDEAARGETYRLLVFPSQKDTHSVSFEPSVHTLHWLAEEELALPIGTLRAHRLELRAPGEDTTEATVARYWFAAEAAAPWLHVLVAYEGREGIRYRLESHERTAYWERG